MTPTTDTPDHADRRQARHDGGESESLWVSGEAAGNRIVLRTVAGGAAYLANCIDDAKLPEVLGTIAGNDSVAIICSDEAVVSNVLITLRDLLDHREE